MKVHLLIYAFVLFVFLAPFTQAKKKTPCHDLKAQQDMNRCAMQEYEASEKEVTKHLYPLLRYLREERTLIKDAHDSWLRYHRKHCEAYAATFKGGSMHPYLLYTCLNAKAKQRVEDLAALLDQYGLKEKLGEDQK